MKRNLLLIMMAMLPLTLLVSCEEENLINAGSRSTSSTTTGTTTGTGTTTTGTTTTSKCYVKDISKTSGPDTYKIQFTYNAKNFIEKSNNDGSMYTYEYDANNRVTKLLIVDGTAKETFTYTYDSKGNITNIKYVAKDAPFALFIKEYNFTSNASGQVTKVTAITDDGNFDFLFDYDAKNNLKKLVVNADGQKLTLIENLTFDDKPNVYANTGLSKVNIPFVLVGAIFGENSSYFMNTNNILTDTGISFLSDDIVTTTYKYELTKEGIPSKMTYVRIIGKDKETGSETYSYNCK